MKAVLLVPAPGDPLGLLRRTVLRHQPGVIVEHGTVPVYCDLVPLPAGLAAPAGDPCSECPTVGDEGWKPYQRSCEGVCAIRGSACVRAAEPGAMGLRRSLVLAWDGERVLAGILRAWFHADDAGTDVLSDLLYDEDHGLPGLAAAIRGLRRNGVPLGEVVTL